MICLPKISLSFLCATVIVVLQKNEAGIYISLLIALDYKYRMAPVDINKQLDYELEIFLVSGE